MTDLFSTAKAQRRDPAEVVRVLLAEEAAGRDTSADVALASARMAAAGLGMPGVRITAESVGASEPDPRGS